MWIWIIATKVCAGRKSHLFEIAYQNDTACLYAAREADLFAIPRGVEPEDAIEADGCQFVRELTVTVYCGVDFHARKQTISYLTTEAGEIQQLELQHEKLAEIRTFYAELRRLGAVVVGFESSGYAAWFEELLEELGCEIWIGHAAEIRRCARRRQKNDRRDAELILELMLRGDFPRLHRFSPESRQVLQQLRYRHRLVKLRTIVLNSLQFMATSRGVALRTKLTTQRGQARLRQLPLPGTLAQQRDELCELLVVLTAKIETAEGWLEKQAALDQRVQRLMTHPGIGTLTGLCLAHTLEGVERLCQPPQSDCLCRLRPGRRLFGRAPADWRDPQTGVRACCVSCWSKPARWPCGVTRICTVFTAGCSCAVTMRRPR